MTDNSDVFTLARWMAGDFSNQAQAFENPPLFAHIRVCMRPVSLELDLGGISLYLEQAYDYMIQHPYRTRLLSLIPRDNYILLKNYTLQNSDKFEGASRDPNRLQQLRLDELEVLDGCDMLVNWSGYSFVGKVEPGKACIVVRNGKKTYLDNGFEIDDKRLVSYDRGRDPETDELVWGTVAGPFVFDRLESFENEIIISDK